MAGKKRRWGRILLGLTLALGAVVSLLWWQAHRESERISYLPSTEAFTDSTKYRLTSLREFVPPLPESVQELGRVAWEGQATRIAFDAKDSTDAKFDVYTVAEDGSDPACISCEVPWLEGRNVGNPAWDPTGRWLLVQIENESPVHGEIALPVLVADPSYPGFGVSSSLWVHDTQTGKFHLLYEVDGENGIGTLHPHFSHDGSRVTWTRLVGSDGCMGDMEVVVADFRAEPEPHLENVEALPTQPTGRQRFFETQDFRDDRVLAACTPEDGQEHHFMDLCLIDAGSGAMERITQHSGTQGEPGFWEEHSKLIDDEHVLFVSSQGYPSPIETCDIAQATFMKWLKTDLYVQNLEEPDAKPERLTFFNEPGHEMDCACSNALASDFSWNDRRQAALLFVQYLDWPRYLPIPIGFDARYFIAEVRDAD